MAAALDDQAFGGRVAHQPAEIEAGDRAARAGADAVRVEGDGEGRPPRMILQPRGEQPDNAGVPFVAGRDDDRRAGADGKLDVGLGTRLGEHVLLHRLALLVEAIERLGDRAGFDRIVGRKQPAAQRGVADPPAGIDARSDQEGEMEGVDRLADARDARQRRKPGILLLADRQQALDHEGAVDAGQRHHVADRRQRDEIEVAEQVGRRLAGRRAGAARARPAPA